MPGHFNGKTLRNFARRYAIAAFAALAIFGAEQFVLLAKLPSIGRRFSAPGIADSTGLCMVSPAQLDKCMKVEVNGVRYTVSFRRKRKLAKSVVTRIDTSDWKFQSPAGKRVGDFVELPFAEIVPAPGFEVYARGRNDAWTAVIGFNGKVMSEAGWVELDSLRNTSGDLRLRIIGFVYKQLQ